MKRFILPLSFLLILAVLTVSCKSTQTVSTLSESERAGLNLLGRVVGNEPTFTTFSSKVKFTLRMGEKEIAVDGNLRMQKNELIQLSIVPSFLGISVAEVGRLEITKDSILLLDRMNKQYVHLPIRALQSLLQTDVDFYVLQSLFSNRLFLPGTEKVTPDNLPAFTVRTEGERSEIRIKQVKELAYLFAVLTSTARLDETTIQTPQADYSLLWKYSDFQPLDGKSFPAHMHIAFRGSKPAEMKLALSRIATGKDAPARTSITSKYRQMDIDQLLKLLMSL